MAEKKTAKLLGQTGARIETITKRFGLKDYSANVEHKVNLVSSKLKKCSLFVGMVLVKMRQK